MKNEIDDLTAEMQCEEFFQEGPGETNDDDREPLMNGMTAHEYIFG